MLILMKELITWIERHTDRDDPLANPLVVQDEDEFVKEVIENIESKLVSFKKLGIG